MSRGETVQEVPVRVSLDRSFSGWIGFIGLCCNLHPCDVHLRSLLRLPRSGAARLD